MDELKEALFGTDGIRGRAGYYPTTPEIALSLGKALAQVLRQTLGRHRVVVGKDTRRSCYFLENAIVSGLCSMGVDTLVSGPLPTPGVAYITRAYRADAGIMISASHNPFYDNGIKIFSSQGFKISKEMERRVEEIIQKGSFATPPPDAEVGKNQRIDDVCGRYIEHLKNSFPSKVTLAGMKIVLDCAHGAAYHAAPLVFWELGAEVTALGVSPNGLNINDKCGSLHPEEIQKGVKEHQADVGIALDGDGDRVIMSDERGEMIDGDQLLAISAVYLKKRGALKNHRVVGTVMTNLGVVNYLKKNGIEAFFSQVGDRFVLQEMLERKAFVGGEQSGHLIFLEHSTTGDGILAALQVLSIMQQSGKKLSELAAEVEKFPQVLVNVSVKRKPPLESLKGMQKILREIEAELQGEGRILVRYSGTENLCRVMVEGRDKTLVGQMAETIAREMKKEVDSCVESQAT